MIAMITATYLEMLIINSAHNNPAAHSFKYTTVACVVRMKVSDENICVFRAYAECLHSLYQGMETFITAKAGVNQQISAFRLVFNYITVEPFKRVVGKDYGKTP